MMSDLTIGKQPNPTAKETTALCIWSHSKPQMWDIAERSAGYVFLALTLHPLDWNFAPADPSTVCQDVACTAFFHNIMIIIIIILTVLILFDA